jgi:hypothetical protein
VWEVKLRDPSDRAAARELEVEEDVAGRSGRGVEGWEMVAALVLWEDLWRTSRRWNWRALARAFSCVRTKLASCYLEVSMATRWQSMPPRTSTLTFMNSSPSSESMIIGRYT